MTRTGFSSSILLLALGCAGSDKDGSAGDAPVTCDSTSDLDQDGLDECEEQGLGLDPTNPDSDGDGLTDLQEVDCGTSPLDASETCYACGWGRNDPGTIQATGSGTGDVIENVALVDQCGDTVNIYDFAGAYHIMYLTTAG